MLIKFALVAMAVYLVFVVVLYTSQRRLLYYPVSFVPSDSQLSELGLARWPAGEDYRGFSVIPGTVEPHAVMVFFHGNAGLAHDRNQLATSLQSAGFQVVLAEYPGYGGRPGSPTEALLVSDAIETVRLAQQQFGLPVYLWGESLGSGVAAAVVAGIPGGQNDFSIEAVVLQAPFNSLVNVAQHHYWYLPVRWLIKDKFNSAENLQHYNGAVAVLVAEFDNVVPAEFGQALYERVNTDKRLWLVNGAEHAFAADSRADWWDELLLFITKPAE